MQETLLQLSIWAIPALVAITLHEAAHGWVAWKLGDDTAYRLGRVTFNPLKHVDPMGTVLLPLMLLFLSQGRLMFGYAKPVPVAFGRLNHPRRDMVLVAAAGPGINLAIATVCALLTHVIGMFPGMLGKWLQLNFENAIWINVLLAVFNMLPLPPLDGGRVAVGLLPRSLGRPLARVEPYGIFVLLSMLFLLPFLGSRLGVDLNLFEWLVVRPSLWITHAIEVLTGAS